ncbi:60S ribosomal protein L6 [Toxorhynchites rutilus septentrionalis]|uniref:60S ribosomal protein L6 n=1 Tax=Toxorhynchites rutilus septentrionalis TaxID=329112 RepID=UPI00247B0AA0|nr:60S ribosomal protein L6 [Toxorhynchites rutilus septentrionalis]
MAPTKEKAPTKAKAAAAPKGDKKAKRTTRLKNPLLADGVRRYAKGKLVQRKKLYSLKHLKNVRVEKPKVAITVVKKIGGAKNGGERKVLLKKSKSYLPTKPLIRKRTGKRCFRNHKRNTRKTLKSGKVLILLAGRHKGKRVVLLKTLKSGLLLISGPFALNSCPLRRISQNYVIATKTRLNLKSVKVPKHINDGYFRRAAKKKNTRTERDIFAEKAEKYVPSEQRKADQKTIDEALLKAINAHPEAKIVRRYLKSMFSLRTNQYPHRMQF